MKTKITTFLKAVVLSAMALATTSFADEDTGFYEKDHIRGFISFGGDFRYMLKEFQNYVNKTAFSNGTHMMAAPGDTSGTLTEYGGNAVGDYGQFDNYYLGLHVNVGAQYKQFLTWFNFNFMPTQISERPADRYAAFPLEGEGNPQRFPLYDVRWFTYGVDWMFGWKLLGESSFINIIPAVGLGFNLINFHLASDFSVDSDTGTENMRDRYYSTMASTFNAEIEVRLEFDPIAIGLYAGYRYVRYNELDVEGASLEKALTVRNYDTDNNGETLFIGLRVTWTFLSDWQKKQLQKL